MHQLRQKASKSSLLIIALLIISFSLKGETTLADAHISGFTDIDLGSWDGTAADRFDTNDLCVYNSDSVNYTITATDVSGAFNFRDGIKSIPYQVRFQGGGGLVNLTYGAAVGGFNNANMVSQTCGGSTNSVLEVRVTQAALAAAQAGIYSATLTLVVTPD